VKFRLSPRNLFCGLCASVLILSGRARRGRKCAFDGSSLTSIYFHNPSRELFVRCVSWLRKKGYTIIDGNQLVELLRSRKPFPKGTVWISLDDGYKEWLTNVLPIVRQRDVPVTLFVPSGIVSGDGLYPWLHDPNYPGRTQPIRPQPESPSGREALEPAQLREVASWPQVQIGGHTVTHTLTPYCTDAALDFEIGQCKVELEAMAAAPVKTFAYPAGAVDGREAALLQKHGFMLAATTEPRFITASTSLMRVPRFCVPDGVTFAEAVCNMVGVWRPFIDPIKHAVGRMLGKKPAVPAPTPGTPAAGALAAPMQSSASR
jgi:peptidoglycan/xylan/chitin deacetylase (PgdA/CDA1 family)